MHQGVLYVVLLVAGPAMAVPLRPDGDQLRKKYNEGRRGLQTGCLVLTGVIDGPLSGGTPKAIELYATCDVADLSEYGVGSANNGGGSDGEEFTFPAGALPAGAFVYVASDSTQFNNFFGFEPNYTDGAANINGDDAIELFQNGAVVDVFGDINVDGTGEPWDHLDGWAYRKAGTGPDGSTFVLANWDFSGPNSLDGETTNAGAANPFPLGTYNPPITPPCLVLTGVIDGPLSGGTPKAIELYATCDVADLSVYGVGSANNGGGSDGEEFTFPAGALPSGAFVYVASDSTEFNNFFGFTPDYTDGAANINGDDAIELFQNGAVVDVFGDINVDGTGEPWDHLDGWAYRKAGTGPDGSTFVLTNWDFSSPNALDGETTNAGAANPFPLKEYDGMGSMVSPSPPAAPPPFVAIHDIQGDGAKSPFVDQIVRTIGVVSFIAPELGGLFIQTPAGEEDGDDLTSEGLFVSLDSGAQYNVGDKLEIQGRVEEDIWNFDQNEVIGLMTRLTSVLVVSAEATEGSTVTPVEISPLEYFPKRSDPSPVDDPAPDIERYEGMLLKLTDPVYVTEYFNFDRYGEVWLTPDPAQYQYTQMNAPDTVGFQTYIGSLQDTVRLDDANAGQNPTPIPFPKPAFSVFNSFRLGDKITDLVGPLTVHKNPFEEDFTTYKLLVDTGSQYSLETINPRPDGPPSVRGRLIKIATFNVLNYFSTLDRRPPSECAGAGPGNIDPRGANTPSELARQGEKLATALLELDADILGLVELENANVMGGAATALESLAVVLNRRIDNADKRYVAATEFDVAELTDGFIGDDAITVGFLYKPSKVKLVGKQAILDESDDTRFLTVGPSTNRPAIAATFKAKGSCGARFTLILNHLKSKSCRNAVGQNEDQNDGVACYNPVRANAAAALVDLANNFKRPIIMGDLNSYAKEDPIRIFEEAGYVNLGAKFEGEESSSFLFNGQRGTLDYALASRAMNKAVKGAATWLINSFEPDILSYDETFTASEFFDGTDPFRASDHDPLIIGLDMCVFDDEDDDDDNDD